MSNSRRLKRTVKPARPRTITLEQLEDWLEDRNPQGPNVSMTDGYLAAVIVSPEFIPPDIWLGPIVGGDVTDADDDSFEGAVRNTLFQRYNEISSTLSGGPKRYAPLFMRTEEGEVLLRDYANGFHLGMSLTMNDWQPFFADPQIAMSMVSILGHCDKRPTADQRVAAVETQTAHTLADSWRIVPEVIEMLHVTLAGSRNVKIC
jgi:uncharacterized protein